MSLGNFYTIPEILEKNDPVALRQLFLASHYRSPMDYSPESLDEAGKGADRIYETIERVGRGQRQTNDVAEPALMDAFRQEMDDDFNTPRALALIFDEVRALNRLLDEKKAKGLEERAAALRLIAARKAARAVSYASTRRFIAGTVKLGSSPRPQAMYSS